MFLLANILKRQRLDVDSKSVGPKNVSNVSKVSNVSVPPPRTVIALMYEKYISNKALSLSLKVHRH